MRTKMKQIVNGLRFDTEKATVVASNEFWDGRNFERNGRNLHLYKTKDGRFFLGRSSQWQGELGWIEPVDEAEAMARYETLPEHEMTYEEAFGVVPKEA